MSNPDRRPLRAEPPSADPLAEAARRGFDAVEADLRMGRPIGPRLRLEGRGGEATLALSEDGEVESAEKLVLLRAALRAETEVTLFPSRLRLRGGAETRVVVAVARAGDASRMVIAAIRRGPGGAPQLAPLRAAIAGDGGADAPPRSVSAPVGDATIDAAEAWRRLGELGVSVDDHGRSLH